MKDKSLTFASIAAAGLASLCCIGPLAAVGLGIGSFKEGSRFVEHIGRTEESGCGSLHHHRVEHDLTVEIRVVPDAAQPIETGPETSSLKISLGQQEGGLESR